MRFKRKKYNVVFLDRDGVINKFPGRGKYITSLKDFKFIKGALEALKSLTRAGFEIFIISNQAGVAKKIYSRATLKKMTEKMLKEIKKAGGKIKRVLYCLHRESDNCPCRKPKTAMITKALKLLDKPIDRKHSYLVGDDISRDIIMGKKARLSTILVLSGRERIKERSDWQIQPDCVVKNLSQAARFIINNST